jgi:ribosome biogenesis GTPase
VRSALDAGLLDAERWAHFQKLGRELAASGLTKDRTAQEVQGRRQAALQRAYRSTKKALQNPSS